MTHIFSKKNILILCMVLTALTVAAEAKVDSDISILFKDVTNSDATLVITNEGTGEQEYIIDWFVKDAVGVIDKGGFPKKIKVNETIMFPINYRIIDDGNYALEVAVKYGTYTRTATSVINVVGNEVVSETIVTTKINYEKYLLIGVLSLVFIILVIKK